MWRDDQAETRIYFNKCMWLEHRGGQGFVHNLGSLATLRARSAADGCATSKRGVVVRHRLGLHSCRAALVQNEEF